MDFQNAAIAAFGNPSDARWISPTGEVVVAAPLRHAEREAREVVKFVGERGQPLHCGAEATRDAVLEALRTADIVHLATHARFCAEAPLFSAFLLANGEQLTVIDLIAVESRCNLIVASACSTGEGSRTNGDDVLGISRGLLACGARAAVVSLWPVDDEQTADLMIAFYRELFRGLDPARSLREAQLTFLDDGQRVPTYAREVPAEMFAVGSAGAERFWSPFTVVGV
jgi:CHAT domain-containing protein